MIAKGTICLVSDNSGAKRAVCIGFCQKNIKCNFTYYNDFITVFVKKYSHKKFFIQKIKDKKKREERLKRHGVHQKKIFRYAFTRNTKGRNTYINC